MRIVLDMNISPIWEKFLNDAGHEAVHWSNVGDIRAQDVEILYWKHYVQEKNSLKAVL